MSVSNPSPASEATGDHRKKQLTMPAVANFSDQSASHAPPSRFVASSKAEANAVALAAIYGIVVTPTETEAGQRAWVMSHRNVCQQLDTLDELIGCLRKRGVKA